MKKASVSRLLVVDASVMRAAGETCHPVSSACRKMLQDILEICHRVIISEPIVNEWDKHASRFSRKWKIAMVNRSKTHIGRSSLAPIVLTKISKEDRTIIIKDRHLLDAAYAHDRVIITTDDKIQKALERTGNEKMLQEIKWLNPCNIETDVLHNL